ncbi:MAG: Mur ligase domain-containing protein, partial [Candidatus Omnitrophica bacterium]|nr:Mur ligase domain-containing protein [Candidatus Omnitrophota bacterium]
MFKLTQIIEITKGEPYNFNSDLEIKGISIDSRTIKEGEAFVAIKGRCFDGHDFIEEAINKKARLIIVSKKPKKNYPIPIILVRDTIEALGDIARFHRRRFSIPVIA